MIREQVNTASQTGDKSPPACPDLTYIENSTHAIDESYRIMLPANWRGPGAERQFYLMVTGIDKYLSVMPLKAYGEFVADLRKKYEGKISMPDLDREINSRVKCVTLDRFGRLPLPPTFLTRVGITKQGVLVGRHSEFEIWQPEKYEIEATKPERITVGAIIDTELAKR